MYLMVRIKNASAYREFAIGDTVVAGVVLTGPEVKSIRLGQASLKGSHVRIVGGEAFLLNAQITPYKFAQQADYDPKRTRKLLLKKRELNRIAGILQQKGLTLVPLALFAQRTVKLEIGVGRGKKQYEKREELKKKQQKREVERMLKGKLRGFWLAHFDSRLVGLLFGSINMQDRNQL